MSNKSEGKALEVDTKNFTDSYFTPKYEYAKVRDYLRCRNRWTVSGISTKQTRIPNKKVQPAVEEELTIVDLVIDSPAKASDILIDQQVDQEFLQQPVSPTGQIDSFQQAPQEVITRDDDQTNMRLLLGKQLQDTTLDGTQEDFPEESEESEDRSDGESDRISDRMQSVEIDLSQEIILDGASLKKQEEEDLAAALKLHQQFIQEGTAENLLRG